MHLQATAAAAAAAVRQDIMKRSQSKHGANSLQLQSLSKVTCQALPAQASG
jgi:hypothetical protein